MSEITVDFYRAFGKNGLGETVVAFRIPDSAAILSRDPEEFMHWCYEQMMSIARDAKNANRPQMKLNP
jgi:hypothetical protein